MRIAQEIQEIYPDAVAINEANNPINSEDKPDFLTIKWEKMVPWPLPRSSSWKPVFANWRINLESNNLMTVRITEESNLVRRKEAVALKFRSTGTTLTTAAGFNST
ncbi:tail fiber protein [Xanthomonas phage JGB6]|nr:tail fiber protein [Xanthomonas phage JGB6]